MTMRTGFTEGEVCWTDLQTSDVGAAKAFYAAVFGWRYEDLPTPDGRSYAQAFLGDDLVTVIAPQNPQQEAAATTPQWNVWYCAEVSARMRSSRMSSSGRLSVIVPSLPRNPPRRFAAWIAPSTAVPSTCRPSCRAPRRSPRA